MRYLLLLAALGLLFGVATAAPLPADTAAIRINRLPATGLLLAKGWRYHAGDNPTWARPDFDDSRWDTITVGRAGQPLPPYARAGMGWFRLRLQLADSLRAQAVGLELAHALAGFEVYLNGQRVGSYGTVSADPAQVRAGFDPSYLVLPLAGTAEQVLAVRFAPWQAPVLLQKYMAQSPLRNISLLLQRQSTIQQEQESYPLELATYAVMGGILFLLGLLHLALFRYHPAQRANQYFAFYALALSAATLPILNSQRPELSGGLLAFAFRIGGTLLGIWWSLRALYSLFGKQPGYFYRGLGVMLPFALVFVTIESLRGTGNGFACLVAFVVLATIEQLRLTVQATRQRRRGAALIGTGFAAGLLVWLLILFLGLNQLITSSVSKALLILLALLAPVFAISLFLAREFALDAQLLQVKLGEVERLSAQTLAQEQDKQALLAAQNETLEQQVTQRTEQLQRSLTDLRATQAQLIQKEKMASLGELTAGIAHEIQNPLNFVNNFSEVSTELVAELKEAQAAGDELEVAALADDLAQNLGKISHHGRRAAAIVKGMLEHSRTSTGERAPTDLNQLADEYLRLAYQGLRARDKTFNVKLETDFAPALPLVEAAGADLGRVLLNLFGNAFYAVQKRQQTAPPGYAPTVSVRTRRIEARVEICVADNGTGIPDEAKPKIFQPFFTTKPTGEGTGLGLSLSYDIITKGHGGTLAVASRAGQGTTFTIMLPA